MKRGRRKSTTRAKPGSKNLGDYFPQKSTSRFKSNSGRNLTVRKRAGKDPAKSKSPKLRPGRKQKKVNCLSYLRCLQNNAEGREVREFYSGAFLGEISGISNLDSNSAGFGFLRQEMLNLILMSAQGGKGVAGGVDVGLLGQEFGKIFEFCVKRCVTLSNQFEWFEKYKPYSRSEVSENFLIFFSIFWNFFEGLMMRLLRDRWSDWAWSSTLDVFLVDLRGFGSRF